MAAASLTRRAFINLAGRAGGAAAVYDTIVAMGLLPAPAAYAGPPALPSRSGAGIKIVVLGAGLAGLAAAYELGKAGYDCTVLEARNRPGGRCWTVRGGDAIEELDNRQSADWGRSEHLYFNVGPSRIPHHHKAILGYCKEFKIPLQIFVNDNRNALLHDPNSFGGKPIRIRQAGVDIRGYLAELLAKALGQGSLDQEVSTAEKERLLASVQAFGQLQADLKYRGSARAGYADAPGAGAKVGQLNIPVARSELTSTAFWTEQSSFGDRFEQSAPLLQPIGGMDRIPAAFAKKLGAKIIYNAVVTQLRRNGDAVRVVYTDRKSNAARTVDAQFALLTLPLTILRRIPSDLSAPYQAAIAAAEYVAAAKVALHARRRFWEEDDAIYGGISWTRQPITQIWYPSHGFHRPDGIMLGAYIWTGSIGETFATLSPQERIAAAFDQGEKLHPNYRNDISHGVAVSWNKIPFSEGAWVTWSNDADRSAYTRLLKPDGPFFFAGEHLSNLPGWMEGAVLSSHDAVRAIAERAGSFGQLLQRRG